MGRKKIGRMIPCGACEKEIYVVPSREKDGRDKYCSKDCMAQAYKNKPRRNNKPEDYSFIHTYKRVKYDGSRYSHNYVRDDDGVLRAEHVIKAEKVLGRKLKKGECVHHINCNPLDNRNQNLLICKTGYHLGLHAKMSDLYAMENFK